MEYVSHCELTINGQKISNFKSVTEGDMEIRRPIKLMSRTVHASVTPSYIIELEYVVPVSPDREPNWKDLRNGTLTISYESGRHIIYSNVSTLKIGRAKFDGENELVRNIEFGAQKRDELGKKQGVH